MCKKYPEEKKFKILSQQFQLLQAPPQRPQQQSSQFQQPQQQLQHHLGKVCRCKCRWSKSIMNNLM